MDSILPYALLKYINDKVMVVMVVVVVVVMVVVA